MYIFPGDITFNNNQIVDATILAKYSDKEKFLFSIKTSDNSEKITTLYSDKAKPFVSNKIGTFFIKFLHN